METSLKTGFAQIFSRCPKNLSCPKFGGGCSPPRPPGPYAYDCDDPEEDLIEETTERDIRFANIWQFWTIFNGLCGSLTDWQKPEK